MAPASEPIVLRIESGPHPVMARIHEALRDLGLECCTQCGIWKTSVRFPALRGMPPSETQPLPPADTPFTNITCSDCNAAANPGKHA